MLLKPREEVDCDSDGGENNAAKEDNGKKKAVCEVKGVPLHYNLKVGTMRTGIFMDRARLILLTSMT